MVWYILSGIMSTATAPEVLLSVPQREIEVGCSNSSMSIHNWKRKMNIEAIGGARTKWG